MSSGTNKKLLSTVLISAISVAVSYAINFILTPYITENVGIEAYGFVTMGKTLVSYAEILTIALTSFVVRYVSITYHENKIEESKSYYASSVVATAVLTFAIFGLACGMISKLEFFLKIPENLVVQVKVLFVIVFLNFILTTMATPLSTPAFIKNRLDVAGLVKMLAHISNGITLFVLFRFFQPRIWYVGIGAFVSATIILIGYKALSLKILPDLKYQKAYVDIEKIKTLVKNGVWNSLNSLGNVLHHGLDLLVSNLMLTAVATGQISVAKTIATMFSTLYRVIFQPYQPILMKAYAEKNTEGFITETTKAMRFCGFFSNVAFAGFIALGKLYYTLWLPAEDINLLYILTMITVFGCITEGIMQPVYYVYTITVKNKVPCWITIAGGLMNVLGMYLLISLTNMGPYAVVTTTTVIMLLTNILFNPIYAGKCLKTSSKPIYLAMLKNFISVTVMTVTFCGIERVMKPDNWFMLIVSAIIMSVVGIVIHSLILGKFWKR